MTDLIARNSNDIAMQLPGLVSMPGDERYASATSTWAKQRGVAPRFVVHCRTASDVQTAIRVAREQNLPLSVRGGGHDWAGRALCDGVVIDLTGMRSVILDSDRRAVTAGGGALVSDITAVTDAHGVAVVAGSVGSVGMTGLTLGGGYGPLIGRFGLALDNVLDMQIVLADGRIEFASAERNEELFWALRGGGGNFGVVTATRHRLHELPGVHSGMLVYPFSEAKSVLDNCAAIAAAAPDEFSVQVGIVGAPDGSFVVAVIPTWCGAPQQGDSRLAPMLRLGTLLSGTIEQKSYGALLRTFDSVASQAIAGVPRLLLAAGPRRRQHRHVRPSDGERRFSGMRHLHPRLQGGGLARAQRMQPRSACGATTSWSKCLRCFPREPIRVTNSGIWTGSAVPAKPFATRFPAAIRTCSAGTRRIAPR